MNMIDDPFGWTIQMIYKVVMFIVAFISSRPGKVKKAKDEDMSL